MSCAELNRSRQFIFISPLSVAYVFLSRVVLSPTLCSVLSLSLLELTPWYLSRHHFSLSLSLSLSTTTTTTTTTTSDIETGPLVKVRRMWPPDRNQTQTRTE
jgi:hypothetical protein